MFLYACVAWIINDADDGIWYSGWRRRQRGDVHEASHAAVVVDDGVISTSPSARPLDWRRSSIIHENISDAIVDGKSANGMRKTGMENAVPLRRTDRKFHAPWHIFSLTPAPAQRCFATWLQTTSYPWVSYECHGHHWRSHDYDWRSWLIDCNADRFLSYTVLFVLA